MALSDSFQAMGLPMSATPSEVHGAWRDMAKGIHPDLGHPLDKFLAAKARMEACLEYSLRLRACEACAGLGRTAKVKGFKTDWQDCKPCEGKGKVSLK